MPFLDKPIPGTKLVRDATGRLRSCPMDYERRKQLLRRAKRGDQAAVRALRKTYRCAVYAP